MTGPAAAGPGRRLLAAAATALALSAMPPSPALAERADNLTATDVSFTSSDGVTLHGTVMAPTGATSPLPAMVLVHGGGAGPREWLHQEAEALAREGIVTISYDKRTKGYSLTERSYSQLADDALAAHEVLRARDGVDPAQVGMWGVSEGGWVAPLAASRSDHVRFVVTVGASGVPPAQQEAWAKENRLQAAGVTGSMLRSYPATTVALLDDAGLFPEAHYDPVPALTELHQPVLAIWGAHDSVSPAKESMSVFAEALDRGGNSNYTLRVLDDGDHAGYLADEGGYAVHNWITTDGQFATGYVELVGSWVRDLVDGPPAVSADAPPAQATTSSELPGRWYEMSIVQLTALLLVLSGFAGYLATGLIRRGVGRPRLSPVAQPARWLAVTGLVTVLGLVGYLGVLLLSSERVIGAVVLGRPIPWLVLQLLALGTLAAAVATATIWWRDRGDITGLLRARLGVLLCATVMFVAWTLSWGLLLV